MEFVVNNLKYTTLTGSTVSVGGNGSWTGPLTIPSTVTYEGTIYSVTHISRGGFQNYTGITSLVISEGVTTLQENAFYGCSGIESVSFPSSVVYFDYSAFQGAFSNEIGTIVIPAHVNTIKTYAFASAAVKNVEFLGSTPPSTVTQPWGRNHAYVNAKVPVGSQAAYQTKLNDLITLTHVYSYPKATYYVDNVIYQDITLKCNDHTVLFPETNPTKEGYVFKGWTPDFPYEVEDRNIRFDAVFDSQPDFTKNGIGYRIISSSDRTVSVETVDKSKTGDVVVATVYYNNVTYKVASISDYAFADCTKITGISFTNFVTSVGKFAFMNCSSMTRLIVPNGGTLDIGSFFIWGCTSLKRIDMQPGCFPMRHAVFAMSNDRPSERLNIYFYENTTPSKVSGYPLYKAYCNVYVIDSASSNYYVLLWGNWVNASLHNMTIYNLSEGVNYFADIKSNYALNYNFPPNTLTSNIIDGVQFVFEKGSASSINGATLFDGNIYTSLYYKAGQTLTITDLGSKIYRLILVGKATSTEYIDTTPAHTDRSTDSNRNYLQKYEFAEPLSSVTIRVNNNPELPHHNIYYKINRSPKRTLTYMIDGQVDSTLQVWPNDGISYKTFPDVEHKKLVYSGMPSNNRMPDSDLTLYANHVDYLVTFKAEDQVVSTTTYAYGETIVVPSAPAKEHYTFERWNPTPAQTMTDGDKVYNAVYIGDPQTITYRVDGQVWQTQNVRYGDTINAPQGPEKTHYNFVGWTPALPLTVTGDLVVDAVYEAIIYNMSFYSDNVLYATISQGYGTAVTPPADPSKTGYDFTGWSPSVPATMPGSDTSYTATYKLINRVRFYPEDFSYQTGNQTVIAEKDGLSVVISCPGVMDNIILSNDTLTLWYKSQINNRINFNLTDSISTVEYYGFDSVNYTVGDNPQSFLFGIEETGTSNLYKDEQEIVDGYKLHRTISFLYDPRRSQTSFITYGTSEQGNYPRTDFNYIEVFREYKYKVTYMVDGQVYRVVEVRPGAVIPDLPVPAKAHKKGSWSGLPDGNIMPEEDITVTAVYTDYSVTFMAQGSVVTSRTYAYGETIIVPTAPAKAHYQFDRWDPTPVVTMTDGDKVYTAVYLGNPHTITYRVDGQVWLTQNVRYDDVISAPVAPEKRYHTFEGWTPALPETVPDLDLIVDAVYEPITYYISYTYDGHEMMKVGYPYNTTVTPPTAALEEMKPGYYVSGYEPALPSLMPGYDFSVEVIYDLKTYYITYIVDGQTYKTLGYLYSLPIQVPVVPLKTGYYGFWDYVPETMPWNDLTVTAVYIAEGDAEIITDWPIFREKLVRDTDGDIRQGNIIGDTFTRHATIASYDNQGAYYLDNVAVLLTDTTDTITTNYFYKRFNNTEDPLVDVELPIRTPDGLLYKAEWLQGRTQNGVIYYTDAEFADTETTYYMQLEDYLEQVNDEFYQVITNHVTGSRHRGNLVHVKSEISSWSGQYYESAYPKWQRNITSADDGRVYKFYIPQSQLTRRSVIVRPAGNTPYQPDFSYGDEPWPYVMYPANARLYREYDSDMFEALFEWYDEDDYPIQAMSKEGQTFVIMTAGATSAGDDYTTLWMMSEGVIYDVIRKPAGTSISAWPAYTRDGYTFSGVSTTSGGLAISLPYTVPSSSTRLYILWTAIPVPPQPQPIPIWTLTYKVLGSVYATVLIPDNELVASYRPAAPSVSGYSFTGWSNEPVRATANATINANFTQVATGVHTLTYKIGNTVIQTMSVATGDVIPVLPYPTRAGYTFDGWTGFPNDMIMPANALTITGSWTAKPDPLAS